MMLEPEKLQNRGKQGWPDAGKGTAERLRREAETPEARQERLQQHRAAESLRREAETPEVRQERLQHHRAAEPALGGKQRLPKQGSNVCSTSIYTYKFLHALRGSLPRCATGNGLQTMSLAACSGSPHNARIH